MKRRRVILPLGVEGWANDRESTEATTREKSERSTNTQKCPHGSTVGLRVHEWGLNPLFWSYVKLFARDVHALGTLSGIEDSHVLHGKAAHRVEVSGIVVHIKPGQTKTFGSYVKYLLDDGTGLLQCTQYERDNRSGDLHQGHGKRHELGELLVVQGKLKRYRGAREVVITSTAKPTDPNEEVLRRLQCIELAKTVYKPPFRRDEYVDDELILSSSQSRPSRCECGADYADATGYCRCVAAPLACDPSFEFRDALLRHLSAKEKSLPLGEHLRFQFARDVRDDPLLKDCAVRVVLANRLTPVDPEDSGAAGGGSISDGGDGTREARNVTGFSRVTHGSVAVKTTNYGAPRGEGRAISETVLNAKVMELLRAVMFSLHRDGAVHFSDKAEDVYVLLSRGKVLQPHVQAVCRERGLSLNQDNEIIRALQSTALFHHVSGARIRACIRHMKASSKSKEEI